MQATEDTVASALDALIDALADAGARALKAGGDDHRRIHSFTTTAIEQRKRWQAGEPAHGRKPRAARVESAP